MNERILGIVFDMDGVLLHSSAIHESAYLEALAEFPIQLNYPALAGRRTDEAIRFLLSESGIAYTDDQIAALSAAKSKLARQKIAEQNPVTPGCPQLLRSLARHYPLALASSASKDTVELFINANHLRDQFACVLHGGDVAKAKPAPDLYRLACERLRLPPENCLVIEDAVSGVQAAKAAGTMVWGIPATSSAVELFEAGADRVIDQLDDLLELLEPLPAECR
jgi:HAD superfamily hydrolase (TIGR01509 family)